MATTISDLWAQHVALLADLEADDHPGGDEYRADDWDRLRAMERAVLDGPICSRADAAAKLKAAIQSFEMGELANGKDEAAIAQTIAWLEARP